MIWLCCKKRQVEPNPNFNGLDVLRRHTLDVTDALYVDDALVLLICLYSFYWISNGEFLMINTSV